MKVCYDDEQFCRRLRSQKFFSTNNHDNCSSTNNTKTKEWTPPDGKNQIIDASCIYHDTRPNLLTNQQTALRDLSFSNDIVIKEADKGGAITIINKDDYMTDCNTLHEDNSTYHKSTTDMMETHFEEAENPLCRITIANKQHVPKLLPTQPKPDIFYALPKLHYLKQLIFTKNSHCFVNKTLINTEQIM